ncbi:type III-A CRISPR-associated protein Cas10/Csm1 [Argonema galeatum]|uniref:type III-A CRISPR-associated protein Cas10/Csm1 n=1 Tax=Argonema galeatum TaxID=2942762 RepID=UPI0020131E33|nr:type III-A CRISPR-associated protein Cas10/Csm1 [Argonema galeatum]MCL1465973.1 type III-A CRISPR-associated protein Cas10/Csm1 [Argonema galeatum A003/A1]
MTHPDVALNAAKQVAQEAVKVLLDWADPELAKNCPSSTEEDAVTKAKNILSWPSDRNLKPLRLLFDGVKLDKGQDRKYYWPARAIADSDPNIPYPQIEPPTPAELECLKLQIKDEIGQLQLKQEDWQNLSLLTLIFEKFGSYISFGESDVALVDIARSTGAIAAALAKNPAATPLSLVAGDLSGIQKFIYTISSDGALKSLRARSFYLELVTEEVVQQLLASLELPRTNVIYAGGGNLYLLASATDKTKDSVEKVREQLNQWLLKQFQGKVFLALDCLDFPVQDVSDRQFAVHWTKVTKNLAGQKSRKFADQISEFIKPHHSHTPCKVCHRDDVKEEDLQPLNEDNSVLACETCCSMFDLGGKLFGVKAIVRTSEKDIAGEPPRISFELPATAKLPAANIYYHLFEDWKQIVKGTNTVLLVNDWTVERYRFRNFRNPVPLLLGNYGKRSEVESGFIRAGEMAEIAKGINRVGYLRMDVDRLGQIFAKGLNEHKHQILPKLAGLSRQMSYFFKVYLNSLAADRTRNLPDNIKQLTDNDRLNLLFIYAGGDDLFVSGAWDEVVEFAFDVYQSFRAYTGRHPDITISAGISIDDVKFPLYQAAKASGEAEDAAKGNGKDSLGLFGQVFKWDEWLGNDKKIKVADIEVINSETKAYLGTEELSLFGVLPFVKILELELNYSRSFIRNLLLTAQLQEQMIKEVEENRKHQQYEGQIKDMRYYLHLPKIAYTLARLPNNVRDSACFQTVRTSFLSPYNAPYFRAIATWIELLNRSKQDK